MYIHKLSLNEKINIKGKLSRFFKLGINIVKSNDLKLYNHFWSMCFSPRQSITNELTKKKSVVYRISVNGSIVNHIKRQDTQGERDYLKKIYRKIYPNAKIINVFDYSR